MVSVTSRPGPISLTRRPIKLIGASRSASGRVRARRGRALARRPTAREAGGSRRAQHLTCQAAVQHRVGWLMTGNGSRASSRARLAPTVAPSTLSRSPVRCSAKHPPARPATHRPACAANPLSAITLRALADMGYRIDASRSRPYRQGIGRSRRRSSRGGGVGVLSFANSVESGLIKVLDSYGRIMRVIGDEAAHLERTGPVI